MGDEKLKDIIYSLAKDAVESYVRDSIIIEAVYNNSFLKTPAAAFVSLKSNDQLRGCLGTIKPTKPTLAEEIIENAVKAATKDYRFQPIQDHELTALTYSVDVLSKMQLVRDSSELDPKKYGVLVQKGSNQGLLLPDLDGVDSVDHQLSIARQKAGILDNSEIEIYKFEVQRF